MKYCLIEQHQNETNETNESDIEELCETVCHFFSNFRELNYLLSRCGPADSVAREKKEVLDLLSALPTCIYSVALRIHSRMAISMRLASSWLPFYFVEKVALFANADAEFTASHRIVPFGEGYMRLSIAGAMLWDIYPCPCRPEVGVFLPDSEHRVEIRFLGVLGSLQDAVRETETCMVCTIHCIRWCC